MSETKEFGDFQTPLSLAAEVVELLGSLYPNPQLVIEPTAGLGTFLKAAHGKWGIECRYEGYEINPGYVAQAMSALGESGVRIIQRDFFTEDWRRLLNRPESHLTLLLGNPPWVTNSTLGALGSDNLPGKTNFQNMRGLDAMTGKANFDISEWMLIKLLESMPESGAMAMLCKTATARKVLRHFWKARRGWKETHLFRIDAKASFNVSVDACLFYVGGGPDSIQLASVHKDLVLDDNSPKFGYVDGELVSDVDTYRELRHLDGGSPYLWRSGLKHDLSQVMDLTPHGSVFRNGYGEEVMLEDDFVFPLLKSSDLANGNVIPRRAVIVTQRNSGDPTEPIRTLAPMTWRYLCRHGESLDARRSSIYRNRPRFSMFGIGPYSFAPWKIAVSGLYKSFVFTLVPPVGGKPVMVDDTCYSIPCSSENEARLLLSLYSSEVALRFMKSLVFLDSKRPITADVLRRLSLVAVASQLGKSKELAGFINGSDIRSPKEDLQMSLLMESEKKYCVAATAKKKASM